MPASTPKKVVIYTDGACKGNPGPGGWAAVLMYGAHSKEIYGSEPYTTNNKMELMAAVEALRSLKEPCQVELVTDSEYVRRGITSWIAGWRRNNWKTSAKKPVLNRELWEALDHEAGKHDIHWKWTKGHAGDALNNRCDELAQRAAVEQVRSR